MSIEQKSPIDDLFFHLMGYYPQKAGQAYEIISSAVLSIVTNERGKCNLYKKGQSGSCYQLDGILGESTMIEAKDYTQRNNKVGRGDLQKLQGALTDLPNIEKGFFTSATDYTKGAIQYAKGSKVNQMQKEIIPVNIRPINEDDENGRIKTVQFNIIASSPDYQKGKSTVLFAKEEKERFQALFLQNNKCNISFTIDTLYDENYSVVTTLENLIKTQQPRYSDTDDKFDICFNINAFVKIQTELFKIKGIKFENVPIIRDSFSFSITPNGDATIFVESKGLGINKIITDTDLINAIYGIIGR